MGDDEVTVLRFDTVGPTIGKEVAGRAALAVGIAAAVVVVYISFAFRGLSHSLRYGICAILAMIHDVAIVISLGAIGGYLFKWQVDALYLTALLTQGQYAIAALSDPLARGAFIGLTLRHGRGHLTRALLEGVAFGLKDSFTLIQSAGLSHIRQVRASGGGTKSPLWRQILADVLGVELVTVNTTEGAAFGAALLAAVGAGNWPDVLSACRTAITITGSAAPHPTQIEIYRQRYPAYRELYPALKPTFDRVPAG